MFYVKTNLDCLQKKSGCHLHRPMLYKIKRSLRIPVLELVAVLPDSYTSFLNVIQVCYQLKFGKLFLPMFELKLSHQGKVKEKQVLF